MPSINPVTKIIKPDNTQVPVSPAYREPVDSSRSVMDYEVDVNLVDSTIVLESLKDTSNAELIYAAADAGSSSVDVYLPELNNGASQPLQVTASLTVAGGTTGDYMFMMSFSLVNKVLTTPEMAILGVGITVTDATYSMYGEVTKADSETDAEISFASGFFNVVDNDTSQDKAVISLDTGSVVLNLAHGYKMFDTTLTSNELRKLSGELIWENNVIKFSPTTTGSTDLNTYLSLTSAAMGAQITTSSFTQLTALTNYPVPALDTSFIPYYIIVAQSAGTTTETISGLGDVSLTFDAPGTYLLEFNSNGASSEVSVTGGHISGTITIANYNLSREYTKSHTQAIEIPAFLIMSVFRGSVGDSETYSVAEGSGLENIADAAEAVADSGLLPVLSIKSFLASYTLPAITVDYSAAAGRYEIEAYFVDRNSNKQFRAYYASVPNTATTLELSRIS